MITDTSEHSVLWRVGGIGCTQPAMATLWLSVSLDNYSLERSIHNEKYFPCHVDGTAVPQHMAN